MKHSNTIRSKILRNSIELWAIVRNLEKLEEFREALGGGTQFPKNTKDQFPQRVNISSIPYERTFLI